MPIPRLFCRVRAVLARLFYRIVAIAFYLVALAAAVIFVLATIVVVGAGHVEHIPMGILAYIFAWMFWDSGNNAWRMSRFDPLYDYY